MEYSQLFRTPAMRFDLIKDEDDGEIHLRDWLLGIFWAPELDQAPHQILCWLVESGLESGQFSKYESPWLDINPFPFL